MSQDCFCRLWQGASLCLGSIAVTLPQISPFSRNIEAIPGWKKGYNYMNEQEILAMYEDADALLSGHFILSSGRHSARYLQSALVLMDISNATALAT